jgi:pimeloyl-ACP methyl ester carboxylesterase
LNESEEEALRSPGDIMGTEAQNSTAGRDVVLIHGQFMTPLSWDRFEWRLRELGYSVQAPGWPGHEGEIEEVRKAAPEALAGLGLADIIGRYETYLRDLEEQPVLVGHSFGGLVVQVLLDRGLGAAGVAIDPAPPKGVHKITLAEFKSNFPVLGNLGNRHKVVGLTFEQYRYAFANTLSEEEARDIYEKYAVPDTGRTVFQAALADFISDAPSAVDYHNDARKPLLMITGSEDHIVPAAVTRSNFRKYRGSSAVTDFKEFPGRSHLIYVEPGWEEVVDYIDSWLKRTLKPMAAVT